MYLSSSDIYQAYRRGLLRCSFYYTGHAKASKRGTSDKVEFHAFFCIDILYPTMSTQLIGNQNRCLDAESAYENVLKRYRRLLKYFNEPYERGHFYHMNYNDKSYICDRFTDVLNSSRRIIHQCLPRPNMDEYTNYDFYLGHVDSENLWHGSGVYSWEWERDDEGDTIIIYFVGEFNHGELTDNGVWCIFSSEDAKERLEIAGRISIGAMEGPSRYCYYAGQRQIRRSPQRLRKIRQEQIIREQQRIEDERRQRERNARLAEKYERERKEREKELAEQQAKKEVEMTKRRLYSNKHFLILKTFTLLPAILTVIVTHILFLSPISIIAKWPVMVWWECILYIIAIPFAIFITALLGCIPSFVKTYRTEAIEVTLSIPIITWCIYTMVCLLPTSTTHYWLYFSLLGLAIIIFFKICTHRHIELIRSMHSYLFKGQWDEESIYYTEPDGTPKIVKTASVSLCLIIMTIAGCLLFLILA